MTFPPELVDMMAGRFKALAEPARLQILAALRAGERTVSELADDTALGQDNLSKHLQLLHALGFVSRRKEGLFVHYALADQDVFRLCDLMCGRLEAQAQESRRALAGR